MATPARHVCRSIFKVSRQLPVKRKCQSQLFVRRPIAGAPSRQFSTAYPRRADDRRSVVDQEEEDNDVLEQPEKGNYKTPSTLITVADLDPEARADYEMLSKEDQQQYLALQNHYAAEFEGAEDEAAMDRLVAQVDRQVMQEVEPLDFPDVPLAKREEGYWATDEDDEFGQVEDDDDDWDDNAITSVAHSELDLHREVREYTRVIAWDMPLLQQFAKPFTPPTEATPLRFRYTTYMGEVHPAARKVVVQFCTKDLPNLTEAQRTKLIKLVGPRYNPDTDMVKMSCEQFEAPAQNKRYLGDQVNKLLDEARNGADKFEDVPLDLRHHKSKKRVQFPEEWKLKPTRVNDLMLARQEQKLLAMNEETPSAEVPDGKELVHSYVRSLGPRGAPLGRLRAL